MQALFILTCFLILLSNWPCFYFWPLMVALLSLTISLAIGKAILISNKDAIKLLK